jgi:hypothetical protein
MGRRKRSTVSSANQVGGCLWHVASTHSDHYVVAPDIDSAIATYLAIPEVSQAASEDPDSTKVREVKRCALCVFALPMEMTYDDDRSQA